MIFAILRLLPALLLAFLLAAPTAAQTSAPPPATTPAAKASPLTPAEAQRALEVLQDPAQRTQLIETLSTIAKAVPSVPEASTQAVAAAPPAVHLAQQGLGAQLLVQASRWLGDVSREVAGTARTVTDFPLLWQWSVHSLSDPEARGELLDATWKLVLVLGCALALEWGAARIVRRPLALLETHTPHVHENNAGDGDAGRAPAHAPGNAGDRHPHLRRTWLLLRLLPIALLRLLLELMPIIAFAVVANLLLATSIGASPATRLAILAVVNAYVLCRGTICFTRMLVAPDNAGLRLVQVSDETAAYIGIWVRRIAVTAIFGGALAEVALLLGLDPAAHDALVKLVALVVHLFLVVIVLQCRRAVSASIRAPEGSRGAFALLRNRLADVWHLLAIFLIIALWLVWAIDIKNGFIFLAHYFAVTIGVLIMARLISITALGALDRVFRISPNFAKRFPGLEARANRYYPLLRGAVSSVVAMIALVALLQVWGIDALPWFRSGEIGGRLISAAITIAITAALAVAVWEGANAAVDRHLARLAQAGQFVRSARLRTLLPMLRTALLITVLTVVGLTALSEIGVNIAPLLAGAGIVGVAIGFGSQKLVQDLITGMFLLLENAMQVGDTVTVGGLSGTVENLSIRTIRLRAGDGSVHIIPFSAVTSVTNANRGVGNASVGVSVSYEEDIDRVAEALKEIALEMRKDAAFGSLMRSDLQFWGVDRVDGSMVTLVGQIVCTDAGRLAVQREFNRRMKQRFEALGIEIANPHKMVVLQEPPDAAAREALPARAARDALSKKGGERLEREEWRALASAAEKRGRH